MAAFFELFHQTEAVIQDSADLAEQMGYRSAAQVIRGHLEEFQRRKLTVVVAGEVKRGKSTLLNALLNEKVPLFPVDVNVCTNVATTVRYGSRESIQAYIEDPGAENGYRVEEIRREQIPDYVSELGNPGNYKRVRIISAAIPNDLLKEGVVFVDTPGVGSMNVEHAETTYGFLPNADMLLFVSDTNSGMTESELNFLRRGYKYCKNILFPLTKKDLNANYPDILEDNRKKISRALGIPGEELRIIPVSSTAKLRYLKTGSRTMLANSNYSALEEVIWSSIARRKGEVLLLPFLMESKGELWKLMENMATQYRMLDADQSIVDGLLEKLDRSLAALEELQQAGAAWRGQLSGFFAQLKSDMNQRLGGIEQEAKTQAGRALTAQGPSVCEEENYLQVLRDVNDTIGQGVLDVREEIGGRIAGQSAALRRQIDVNLGGNEEILGQIGFSPNREFQVDFPPKTILQKIQRHGGSVPKWAAVGGTIGGILGAVTGLYFGGPALMADGFAYGKKVGSVTGALSGALSGCIQSLEKYDQLDVKRLSDELANYISAVVFDSNVVIDYTINRLRASVNDSFEDQLKTRIGSQKENIAIIRRNISLSEKEAAKQRAALEAQDLRLKKQLARYDQLEGAIDALTAAV